MRALSLREPGCFERIEADPPGDVHPGWARVRVRRVGICGTDLHAYRGRQPFFRYPRILGHELGVEVLETARDDGAPSSAIRPGDLASVEPYLHCGECVACRRGRTNCCERLRVLGVHIDGGMQDEILVPAEKLHRSALLSVDQLALVETLGIGCHAVERGQPAAIEKALIVGAGPIGLAVAQFATLSGAEVRILDLNPARLAFAARSLDLAGTIPARNSSSREDRVAEVRAAFAGDLPTLVFEATGNAESMAASFDLVASSGRLVLVGLVLGEIAFNDPEFHRRELSLLASRNARPSDFRQILQLLESGLIDTAPWITHRADYDSLIGEFPTWLDPAAGVVKAMLDLDD